MLNIITNTSMYGNILIVPPEYNIKLNKEIYEKGNCILMACQLNHDRF
jgi:hypothetical protein